MKILLVVHKYGVPLNDPACFPIGYMTIGAVLKEAGHDVTWNNQNIHGPISFNGFDIVGFTGFEEFLDQIKIDAAICKEKGIKTILGGALATFKPDEMLEFVDTVFIGESEDVVCESLEKTGIIYGNSPDLSKIPWPDYEGFGAGEYHLRNGLRHISILTTRGCPYSCRFCSQTCSFQFRDIDDVMAEIESFGHLDAVAFVDNTFNLKKDRFMEICERIDTEWAAAIRVDVWDDDMAFAAKASGCQHLVIGVESFRQEKLDAMNKRITTEQISNCLDSLHRHDIGYHGNILLGLPGESVQDIIKELSEVPSKYNVFPVLVQPFIGTEYQTRDISKEDAQIMNMAFAQAAANKDMHTYPTS